MGIFIILKTVKTVFMGMSVWVSVYIYTHILCMLKVTKLHIYTKFTACQSHLNKAVLKN